MRYKTLFRLMLKLLGVYFFVVGAGALISVAASIFLFRRSGAGWSVEQGLLSTAHPAFELLVGLYLFFGGQRLADHAIPSNRSYCPECGYDVTGSASRICPECGIDRERGQRTEISSASAPR
jgi:hypothetical protein